MAERPGNAADDMLIDFDRIDRETVGNITAAKVDSVLRMRRMDLPADWISAQLRLEQADVERIISHGGYSLR